MIGLLYLFMSCILYLFIGCTLSVPYTYLANGNSTNLLLTACIAPVASLFLLLFFIIGKRKWHSLPFWILLAYFCLPIILNGISITLGLMGYETISHYVFLARYPSLLVILITLAICSLIANSLKEYWIKHHRHDLNSL